METIRALLQENDDMQNKITTAIETIYESDNIINNVFNLVVALEVAQHHLTAVEKVLLSELRRMEQESTS